MRTRFWSLICLLGFSSFSYAENRGSLKEWVLFVKKEALQVDEDYQAVVNNMRAAESVKRQSIFEFAPSLSYSASIDDGDTHASHALSASVNLFNGLQDYHSARSASQSLKARKMDVDQASLSVELNIAKRSVAWLDLIVREEVLNQEVRSRKTSLEIMEKRFRRGIVAEDEVLKLKVDALSSEVEHQDFRTRLKKTKLEFKDAFGVDLEKLKIEALPVPPFEKTEKVMASSLSRVSEIPEVRSKWFDWKAAEENHHEKFGAVYSPSLTGTYSYANSPSSSTPYEYNSTFGISLSLPIFSQLEDRDAEVRARLSADSARLRYQRTQEAVTLRVKKALEDLKRLRQSYELQKNAVRLAEKFYSQSVKRFRLGVGDSNNMAFDLQRLTRAKLALSRIKREYFEASIDFSVAMGYPISDVF